MKTHYFLIGLLVISTPLRAEIYKWTDSDGDVHFSDKVHEGAETVTLPPVQVYSPPPQEIPSAPILKNKPFSPREIPPDMVYTYTNSLYLNQYT